MDPSQKMTFFDLLYIARCFFFPSGNKVVDRDNQAMMRLFVVYFVTKTNFIIEVLHLHVLVIIFCGQKQKSRQNSSPPADFFIVMSWPHKAFCQSDIFCNPASSSRDLFLFLDILIRYNPSYVVKVTYLSSRTNL